MHFEDCESGWIIETLVQLTQVCIGPGHLYKRRQKSQPLNCFVSFTSIP